MTYSITNYDGGITTTPRALVYPETVEEIQQILGDSKRYPSPVRAMGSFHSLTPCVSSEGTIVNTSRMKRVVDIDREKLTFTAQAGLQFIEASQALRARNLQFRTNIEIGNLTLGSAACCHTKDALDGIEFGQVSSYVTRIKWVNPSGQLEEASEDKNPDLLRLMRSSHGLCGIVYEATFRVEPMEAAHFTYLPRPIDDLTEAEVSSIMNRSEGLICWTVGRTVVFQRKETVARAGPFAWVAAAARHRMWNHGAAYWGRKIQSLPKPLRNVALNDWFALLRLAYRGLHVTGGLRLYDPGKTVDYSRTKPSSRYAFTFWAFPRAQWLQTLREYLEFSQNHFRKYDFRCNMPMGSYYIRRDTGSLLSYSADGDICSLDPIHASTDQAAWERFLREFNDFAAARNGIPLLNQSPFVTREHVEAAYGERWRQFSTWVRAVDPSGRMLNPFFSELLSSASLSAAVVNR
jgi:FAD/FMN-containing dehydrogenase